jgi:type IV secretory pathway VirB10-like protein
LDTPQVVEKLLRSKLEKGVLELKQRTLAQVTTAKLRAENFLRTVIGDEGRADEVSDETPEEYAARKDVEIVNPTKRRKLMSSKQELEELVDQQASYIEELEEKLETVRGAVGAPDTSSDEDESDDEDESLEDESDDEDESDSEDESDDEDEPNDEGESDGEDESDDGEEVVVTTKVRRNGRRR